MREDSPTGLFLFSVVSIITMEGVIDMSADPQGQTPSSNELQVTCEGRKFPLSELPNVQRQVLELLLKFVQDEDELTVQKPEVSLTLGVTIKF